MNELITTAKTMSSREIAELTSKRHDHIIRDIEKMLDELEIAHPKFGGSYIDATGRSLKCYNLPKRESLILVSGYNIKMRAAIIDRWQELEEKEAQRITQDTAEPVPNLKTTSDLASELCFKWTLNKYQYHLSAAFYQQGFKLALGEKCDFFFIVIETFKPHNYAIYKIGDDLLERGYHLCREALRVYKQAESRGSFELPYNNGNLLELVA